MRISDWSSDVCSSDLLVIGWLLDTNVIAALINPNGAPSVRAWASEQPEDALFLSILTLGEYDKGIHAIPADHSERPRYIGARDALEARFKGRSEEHTSELQSLMRISYAVFCLKKKNTHTEDTHLELI